MVVFCDEMLMEKSLKDSSVEVFQIKKCSKSKRGVEERVEEINANEFICAYQDR